MLTPNENPKLSFLENCILHETNRKIILNIEIECYGHVITNSGKDFVKKKKKPDVMRLVSNYISGKLRGRSKCGNKTCTYLTTCPFKKLLGYIHKVCTMAEFRALKSTSHRCIQHTLLTSR